jgi:phosphomannomutase / phosphoglucomutase
VDEQENKSAKPVIPLIVAPSPSSAAARAAARAQEQAKRETQRRQRLLFILLGAAVLINAVLAYVLQGIMVEDVSRAQEQQLIDQELGRAVSRTQSFLRDSQTRLDELAKNGAVMEALKAQNTDAQTIVRESFFGQFDNAVDLKVIVAGSADLSEGPAPIRFSELDLIRRAERGEKALPEAAHVNDNWQVNFVTPVKSPESDQVLGVLMLTLSTAELRRSLGVLDVSLGETLIQQKFANSSALNIVKLGAGSAMPSQEKPVADSHWLVKYTASAQLVARAQEPSTLWLLAVCGSGAISLVLALLLSRSRLFSRREKAAPLAPPVVEASKPATEAPAAADAAPSPLYQAQDILDVAVIDEDENILGLQDSKRRARPAAASNPEIDEASVPSHIFRSYDIRGIVGKDLTVDLAEKIGQAVGSEALDQGETALIVARDGRSHSQELTSALISGILSTGCNVVNVGVVPTPVMYFATYYFDDVRSGVMVTASHNPREYNGFKVVINNNALADEAVLELRNRILRQRIRQGLGEEMFREIVPHYIERIFSDVALAGDIHLVVDAGNAVPGLVAPQLFEELGCQVTPLYCELDGSFPNHDPDPTQEHNLLALTEKVKEVGADMGVAFDGDGDRLVVVTPKGDIIWPDRLLMLFAKDVLARNPGADVLFDVKCSRQLNQVISGYGGRPIMWKTGHSPMKAKMVETGALIGGEYSGHIFIKDRWYGFDDGIYAMARLLEIITLLITLRDQNVDDIFAAFPQLLITPEIKVPVPDATKFELIKKLAEQGDFQNANITSIDGIRVDYSKGWGLVRASNTSPALTLRFEAETPEALAIIQQIFKRELLKIDSSLALNF